MKPWLEPALTAVLASRAHAQLIEGAAGLGQFDLALAAAKAWLCDTPLSNRSERPEGRACGQCESCRAADSHTHHDLQCLLPETVGLELGVPLNPKAQEQIDKGERKASKQIRLDAVLDLVSFAQQTSARGRGKVALVYPAERMNDIAANALLKVLEEPPGDMHFLLVCESGAGVMPTIRSRCQVVRLTAPGKDEAHAWLNALTAEPQAAGLLAASGGLPLQAVAWAQAGMTAERWAALPAQLAAGNAGGAEVLAGLSLPQAVEVLQKCCHDLTVSMTGAAPRFFAPVDLGRALALCPSPEALAAWWDELLRQARHAEHPVVLGLAFEALVVRSRRALHSAASTPAP